MTDPYEPTTALPHAGYLDTSGPDPYPGDPGLLEYPREAGLHDPPAAGRRVGLPGRRTGTVTGSGLQGVRPEEPRAHPVTYLALVLSLIALLWLALSSGSGEGYQKVRVGSQDCVSVPQDAGPAALYCRTTATPH